MCIINMAASDEAIINRLLYETMKVERKEFEGQRRSNESDIILHRQRLAQEHVRIVVISLWKRSCCVIPHSKHSLIVGYAIAW